MAQIQAAQKNKTTKEMKMVAKEEKVKINWLRNQVSKDLVVIPANRNHKNLKPIGIGFSLRTKINTNLGTSLIKSDLKTELEKLKIAIEVGTDTVMDLSTGGNLDEIRKKIIENCPVPSCSFRNHANLSSSD